MNFKALDTVVLTRDVPDHGLLRGDLGVVVELYEPDGVEVEFVAATGRTESVVTLKIDDVRHVSDSDLLSVRSAEKSA